MKITDDILSALKQAVEASGSQRKFAKKCEVRSENISKYLSGQVKEIKDDCWTKLKSYLDPYFENKVAMKLISGMLPEDKLKHFAMLVELLNRKENRDLFAKVVCLCWKQLEDEPQPVWFGGDLGKNPLVKETQIAELKREQEQIEQIKRMLSSPETTADTLRLMLNVEVDNK